MEIYFVGDNFDYDQIRSKGDALFVCFSWFTYSGLKRKGFNAMVYDDLLTNQESNQFHEDLHVFNTKWHEYLGQDITAFNGVSLGEIYHEAIEFEATLPFYKLVLCAKKIISLKKPKRVLIDRSLDKDYQEVLSCVLKSELGVDAEFCSGESSKKKIPVPHKEQLVKQKNLKRDIFIFSNNFLSAITAPKSYHNILVTYYPSMDNFFLEWKRDNQGINLFLANRMNSAFQKKNFLLDPIKILGPNPTIKPNPSHVEQIKKINELWNAMRNDRKHVQTLFTYLGVDLSELVLEKLDRIFYKHIEEKAWMVAEYLRILKTNKISFVVVPFDIPPRERAIVQVARLLNIPSMVVLHGYPGPGYSFYPRRDNLSGDYFVLGGTELQQVHQELSPNKPKILRFGTPNYDLFKQFDPELPSGPCNERLKVLLLANSIAPDGFPPITDRENYILDLLAMLKKYPIDVTVKLHPSESTEYYVKLLQDVPDICIIRDQKIFGLIMDANLVICPFITTSFFESVLMGKRTIMVNLRKWAYASKNPQKLIERFETYYSLETLESKIKGMVSAKSVGKNPDYRIAIEESIGPIDGNASKRIIDFIANLLH
jgi:hypothetical protein